MLGHGTGTAKRQRAADKTARSALIILKFTGPEMR